MRQLIDKESLIEAFENLDWYHINNGKLVHGATSKDGLYKQEDVFNTINEAPPVQHWTLCSDHQPKKDGRYIVTIKLNDRLTIVSDLYFRMDIYDEFDEDRNEHRPGWLSWSDEYGFSLYYDESKVIAWIPYPKPAEER